MRVLFIGGTGNISAACARLAVSRGIDLHILNRGNNPLPVEGVTSVVANIKDADSVAQALGDTTYDCVVNFIAFTPEDIERDIALFAKRTQHYVFISSASAYQKPATSPFITESTPLANPHWEYSRQKIACEERLTQALRESGFPGTIVRPSLTYDTVIPLALCSWDEWTVVDRMLRGERVVVHGDGQSVWTITHSDDFAIGLVGLMGNPDSVGHAFHITSDEVLTWDQIHRCVGWAVGVQPQMVHVTSDDICGLFPEEEGNLLGDKAVSTIFDNSKIKYFVPDFRARIPFAHGIRRTIDWFRADPARLVIKDASNQKMDRLLALADQRAAEVTA